MSEAGSRIAGYLLEEQIGEGGMAVVFRAHDERLDRRVALKILSPALAADEAFRQRFIRESRAAAAVDDPHIIPVFDAGEADGALFIAMRYVRGGDVRLLVQELTQLAPERAAEIISQVASALDAAHSSGLVHRDVKPANMLLDASGGEDRPDHVYLSDFGLSKETLGVGGLTATGQFMGTLAYIAPEQIEGKAVDGRADQYALACTAFELLTGAPPFQREGAAAMIYAQLFEPPPPLTSLRPGLRPGVDQVLMRALDKAPDNRYGSCREFANALRQALGLATRDSGPGVSMVRPLTEVGEWAPVAGVAGVAAVTTAKSASPKPGVANLVTGEAHMPGGNAPAAVSAVSAPVAAPPRSRQTPVILVAVCILVAAGVIAGAILARSSGSGTPVPAAVGKTGSGSPRIAGSTSPQPTGSASPQPAGSSGPQPAGSSGPGITSTAGYQFGTTLDPGAAGSMSGVSWNPSGTLVALSDKNGSAYVWDIATGRMHGRPLTVPGAGKAYSAAFSPDGRTLAVGYSNGVSYLWNVASGRRIATLSDPGGREIDSVAFNPTGSELVTADGNGHAYVWDITTGHQNDAPATALPDPAGAGVWSAVFSAGGMLATGDYNGNIYLWNVSTGQSTGPLVIPGSSPVSALAFSPDGSVIAAGNESGSMYLFGVAGQNGSFIYSASSIWALSFAGNTTLAMADRDGDTYLWRVNATALSASRIGTLRDPNSGSAGVGSLAFSHNGQWLVTGDTNGSAYSWKVG